MAKVYGNRWQVLATLTSGGQAEVFKVHDLRKEYTDELVLKRVLNPKRHDRFRAEVEAIRRLNHPNVVRLIDHSALSDDDISPEKQFIVMPYARHGDLSSRVALYENSPDSVIQVAKSLALGLQAAHADSIVHRDVKPENILFLTATHDVWLADFGICLIRDLDRRTLVDEIVGPRHFMAPELEAGGQLEVTPAADVYSLGKVIYYMLSGGTIVPRERIHDPEYAKIFMAGERQRLLQMRLLRMICSLPNRLTSMVEVLNKLNDLANWERDARLLPIETKTMSKIDEMKRKALEVRQKAETNADIRIRRNTEYDATVSGVLAWFQAELEKTGALIDDGDIISAGVRVTKDRSNSPSLNNSLPGPSVELWVRNKAEVYQREHVHRFVLSTKSGFRITTRVVTGTEPSMALPGDEPEHTDFILYPVYGRKLDGATPNNKTTDWRFITHEGQLYRPPQPNQLPAPRGLRQSQPHKSVNLKALSFSTSDWPSIAEHFSTLLSQSADTFVSAMNVTGSLFD